MSVFQFLGRASSRSQDQLERDTEDAFETANAAWDVEHGGDGRHTAITVSEIGPRTTDPVLVSAGLRFTGGPWIFERDGTADPTGDGAVLRAPSLTADRDNYAPAGIEAAVVLELESTAARTITGIAMATSRRRFLWVVNRGNFSITLAHNSGSSSAVNRIAFSTSADYVLRSGGILMLYYDSGSGNWRGEGQAVKQIRTVFTQTVTWTNGGGTTQNFTLSTTLANYQTAVIENFVRNNGSSSSEHRELTSNTNIAITGTSAESKTFTFTVVEYQHLDA